VLRITMKSKQNEIKIEKYSKQIVEG